MIAVNPGGLSNIRKIYNTRNIVGHSKCTGGVNT